MFFHTIMSIFSIRKKDDGVLSVVTSPTHHLWAAARASYSVSPPPYKAARGRGVSFHLFLETCAESACSPRAA